VAPNRPWPTPWCRRRAWWRIPELGARSRSLTSWKSGPALNCRPARPSTTEPTRRSDDSARWMTSSLARSRLGRMQSGQSGRRACLRDRGDWLGRLAWRTAAVVPVGKEPPVWPPRGVETLTTSGPGGAALDPLPRDPRSVPQLRGAQGYAMHPGCPVETVRSLQTVTRAPPTQEPATWSCRGRFKEAFLWAL
jgi:hypothetical protein